MAGSLGSLNIQLSLDSVKFTDALEKSKAKAKQFSDRTVQYLQNIENAAKSINKTTNFSFIASLGNQLESGASSVLKYANSYTEISNRLRLVESSAISSAKAMDTVFNVALKTNQNVESTASVYQRFAQNAETLKISQSQIASLTETVSKAVAISGASASSASAALTQFGQALGSGVFRGDEFNSVMEQTPSLAAAIAKGLGVTTGELRQMAKEGKLTTDVLIPALEKAKDSVDEQFSTRVLTVSAAFENLNTATTKWIGEMDHATGASEILAKGIGFLSNNITPLAAALTATSAAVAIEKFKRYTISTNEQAAAAIAAARSEQQRTAVILEQTQKEMSLLQIKLSHIKTDAERILMEKAVEAQKLKLTAAINAEATAQRNLAVAQRGATLGGRALSGALGLVGGPWGLIAIGAVTAASAIYEWYEKAEQAKQAALEYSQSLDTTKESLQKMNNLQLQVAQGKLADSISAQEEKVKQLRAEYEKLRQTAQESVKVEYYTDGLSSGIVEITKSEEQLRKERQKANEALLDLQNAEQQLAEAKQKQSDITTRLTEQEQEFIEQLRNSVVQTDIITGKNAIWGQQTDVTAGKISNLSNQVDGLAVSIRNLAGMNLTISVPQIKKEAVIGEKAQAIIDQSKRDIAIRKAKNPKQKAKLQAENWVINHKGDLTEAELNVVRAQKETEYFLMSSSSGGRSKPARSQSKGAGTDYTKQYTDQLTEMQQRLAQVRADAQDIASGQISQYQEVSKLNQDIAANAEKYAHYGVEGLAKLKEMAAQIDSAHQQVAIAQFGVDNREKIAEMEFELQLLGKTAQEQERLQYYHQLDIEAAKLKQGMTEENVAKLDEEIAKIREKYALTQQQIELEKQRQQADPVKGFKDGMKTIEDDVSNVAGNISNLTVNAFGQMSDALTDFVMTGKADFKSLATSILSDISKMIIKMMLFNAIKSAASAMGFSSGGEVGGYARGGLVGFDEGGFTGLGGKYSPAGIVHRGEYVLTKEATSRIGLDYLNYLNYGNAFRGRGFANGGGVGVPKVPTSNLQHSHSPNVTVKVINNGEPVQAEVRSKSEGNQMEITVELVRQIAQQEANGVIQQNFRAGGAFA